MSGLSHDMPHGACLKRHFNKYNISANKINSVYCRNKSSWISLSCPVPHPAGRRSRSRSRRGGCATFVAAMPPHIDQRSSIR